MIATAAQSNSEKPSSRAGHLFALLLGSSLATSLIVEARIDDHCCQLIHDFLCASRAARGSRRRRRRRRRLDLKSGRLSHGSPCAGRKRLSFASDSDERSKRASQPWPRVCGRLSLGAERIVRKRPSISAAMPTARHATSCLVLSSRAGLRRFFVALISLIESGEFAAHFPVFLCFCL